MKKLSKMTLLHVEKISDSEMKQILGGNSLVRNGEVDCYEEYSSVYPPITKCSGSCPPYSVYDSSTGKMVITPRLCKASPLGGGCECLV